MHYLPDQFNPRRWRQPPKNRTPVPLTRKAFYRLADESRQIAFELARHDQHRVNLERCHAFNGWLAKVKRYDHLALRLRTIAPARPVARSQILIIGLVMGVFLLLLVPPQVGPVSGRVIIYAYTLSLICFYFIPERLYGTTVELLEGKMLRIVEEMEALLMSGQVDFSQAAYFQTKENLNAAKRELRQQVDLAHRKWR